MTTHTWPGDVLQADMKRLERELRLAESREADAVARLKAAEQYREGVECELERARNELKGGAQ